MTLKECYGKLGGDYNAVLGRLMRESMVQRFALKFLQDKSFEELTVALEKEDYNEAFRMAHTLKGVSQNLGFDRLYKSVFELTEAIRDGKKLEEYSLYEAVKADYELTIEALNQLDK